MVCQWVCHILNMEESSNHFLIISLVNILNKGLIKTKEIMGKTKVLMGIEEACIIKEAKEEKEVKGIKIIINKLILRGLEEIWLLLMVRYRKFPLERTT